MAEDTTPGNTPSDEPQGAPEGATQGAPEGATHIQPQVTAEGAPQVEPQAVPAGATQVMPVAAPTDHPLGAGPTVPSGSRVVIVVSKGPSPIVASVFVEMPDVVGARQGDALSALQDTGLSVQVFNDYSATVERGRVMAQRPALSANVPVGSEVVLLVSSGTAAAQSQPVALPRVTGLREGEAITRLQAARLSPQVVLAHDPGVPAGTVIAQLPDEISLATIPPRRRSTAWVWIAIAIVLIAALAALFYYYQSRLLVVPNVVGLSQVQAQDSVTSAGFRVAGVLPTQTISAAEIGNVVTQTPSPNSELKRGSGITITVSGGQALVPVPNVLGMVRTDAEKALKDAGFLVAAQQAYSSTVAKDAVVSQSPIAAEKVPVGTTVGVIISQGAEDVGVPGVLGQTQAAAVDALKAAGLGSQVVSGRNSSVARGQVFGQIPTAGTSVAPKTVIGLLVSDGPLSSTTSSATVPAVVGRSLVDAKKSLTNSRLTGVTIMWGGTGKAVNTVVAQLPEVGSLVARNSSVILIVSNGK